MAPGVRFTVIDPVVLTGTAMIYASVRGTAVLDETPTCGPIGLLFSLAFLAMLFVLILCVAAVGLRFRAARGDERLQLKGFLLAALLFGGTFVCGQLVASP